MICTEMEVAKGYAVQTGAAQLANTYVSNQITTVELRRCSSVPMPSLWLCLKAGYSSN
jgi:hypothetical protein